MFTLINKLHASEAGRRFGPVTAVVLALFIIGEQFPFSNFPMYSNFDSEAEVIYIADQTGAPVAMDKAFRSGSSTAKKAYKKELGKLTSKRKRDSNDATESERREAGRIVLGDWFAVRKDNGLPSNVTALRLYRRAFQLNDGRLAGQAPELLAEQSL